MIRLSQDQDLPALFALWQEAFEGDAREAALYFTHRIRREDTLVATSGEALSGMLTMLPLTLSSPQGEYPARYVFAVATFKRFRGQGISSRLLDAAHARMKADGVTASLLVPATPPLFDFYGKRGYETRFFIDFLNLLPQDLPPAPLGARVTPCGAQDYLRLRDQAFAGSALYARWDLEALRFAIHSLTEAGSGGALRVSIPQGQAVCLYEKREEGLRITELAPLNLGWETAMAALHQHLRAPAYTLHMPEGSLPKAQTLPLGMIRWLGPVPQTQGGAPYLSIAKD